MSFEFLQSFFLHQVHFPLRSSSSDKILEMGLWEIQVRICKNIYYYVINKKIKIKKVPSINHVCFV